jgi:small-conductance mechanosensitive channel/CRP-like cAMP-binding protein
MGVLVTAGTTAVLALALSVATRNRVARGKLRFAAVVALIALVLSGAIHVPALATAIPPGVAALDELLVGLAIIVGAVGVLLNPFLSDRSSARFPNIVQDAVIVVLTFIATTFVMRDTGLVAASAASAVVVGFALQDTLGNAFAGLAIQIEKPFRVGHWIKVGEHVGVVEAITWRATKLRTRAGAFVIVPNSVMSKEAIVNFNEPVRPVRFSIDIGATYAKGPNEVREALFEAVRRSTRALAEPAPVVHLVDFGNSAIVYRVKFWVAEFAEEDAALDEVRTGIYYSFARHGIEIPYPIQIEYSREEMPATLASEAVATALGGVDLFALLDDGARRQLAARTRERVFGAGEVIVRQGDTGRSLFVIHQGEVVVRLEPDGREVARTHAGGVFGEMSLLTGDPRTATVAAARDSVILEIDADALRDVVLNRPDTIDAISRLVVERRAGLDAAQAAARDEATLTAQSQSLIDRMRRFLRL